MIKVYVVDDEKLVRRGIIGLIDWERYGMEVVGDTGSSEEALDFLRRQETDILFSDLEMPGLSGIAFLQEVKKIRPGIQIVVLTMHQEFELIQQALRLGILDYVTKAQIEDENVDAFMDGVIRRYSEKKRQEVQQEKRADTSEVYIWILSDRRDTEKAEMELRENHFNVERLGEHCLILPGTSNIILLKSIIERWDRENCTLLELKQVLGIPYDRIREKMDTIIGRRLFQDRIKGCFCYSYQFPQLQEEVRGCGRKEALQICTEMCFMTDSRCYEEGMEKIKKAELSVEERIAVFYHFALHWAEFSGKEISGYFEETGGFVWWYQWKEWFDEVRALVLGRIGGMDEKLATMEAIHEAMQYIRDHMDQDVTLEELLRLTGMSKSYFSKKFKAVTGKTFVTYLNDLRIESAKKYLEETDQPVYWIARQVGYADERYFRRIFRERTGENPKKYRQND